MLATDNKMGGSNMLRVSLTEGLWLAAVAAALLCTAPDARPDSVPSYNVTVGSGVLAGGQDIGAGFKGPHVRIGEETFFPSGNAISLSCTPSPCRPGSVATVSPFQFVQFDQQSATVNGQNYFTFPEADCNGGQGPNGPCNQVFLDATVSGSVLIPPKSGTFAFATGKGFATGFGSVWSDGFGGNQIAQINIDIPIQFAVYLQSSNGPGPGIPQYDVSFNAVFNQVTPEPPPLALVAAGLIIALMGRRWLRVFGCRGSSNLRTLV